MAVRERLYPTPQQARALDDHADVNAANNVLARGLLAVPAQRAGASAQRVSRPRARRELPH